MKKLVLVLTMLLAFAFSSLAFAADGGDLNKEQRTAEKMMTALEGDAATSYATFAPALSAEQWTRKTSLLSKDRLSNNLVP